MGIHLDDALGVSPYAMQLKLDRAQVIASNLANADTPGYLAQDIDYQSVMQTVATELANHDSVRGSGSTDLLYRMPYQVSEDGNTVELQVEQGKFAEDAQSFNTSLAFLNQQLKGLKTAIEGS